MLLRFPESVLCVCLVFESSEENFCFIHLEKIIPQAGQVPGSAVSASLLS